MSDRHPPSDIIESIINLIIKDQGKPILFEDDTFCLPLSDGQILGVYNGIMQIDQSFWTIQIEAKLMRQHNLSPEQMMEYRQHKSEQILTFMETAPYLTQNTAKKCVKQLKRLQAM